ncbi:MAG TPA: hypothetical protein PLH65_02170, partial [bacterium]|nr:hypothetical protein [bacterium]
MSKKNRPKHKKVSKSDILQATQKHASDNPTVSSAGSAPSVVAQPNASVAEASLSTHKYGGIFDHVKTDMSFFLIMIILFAVILAVIYYFDRQNGIILQAGNWLYGV